MRVLQSQNGSFSCMNTIGSEISFIIPTLKYRKQRMAWDCMAGMYVCFLLMKTLHSTR